MNRFFTQSKNPSFGHFWAQIGPENFFCEKNFLSPLERFNSTPLYKKSEKTKTNNFFENRAPSHFGHHHFAPLCQKSEKTNEPIPRKVGNRQTNERTN